MTIRSLDHLVLTVADVDATVAFYERIGMRLERFDGDRLALRFGKQRIHLHRAGGEIEPHAQRPQPGSADLCFLVEGRVDDVERKLREAGVAIEFGPVDRSGAVGQMRSLYLRDPDGNLVELSEPASNDSAAHVG